MPTPSLFLHIEDSPLALPKLTPGCEWILANEGIATRKRDGVPVMVDGRGRLHRQCVARIGQVIPAGFQPRQEPDLRTKRWLGWIPVGDRPEDQAYWAAPTPDEPGTYELCGPAFCDNAEGFNRHVFFKHGDEPLPFWLVPSFRSNISIEAQLQILHVRLSSIGIEGIVWHHPDGRTCKVKRSDFGLPWPLPHS